MDLSDIWPVLHTRAETWECDFNGHWNTRFYCRSFEQALRTLGASASVWHLRFHEELLGGDPAEVRAFAFGPKTAFVMTRYGHVVATALCDAAGLNLPALPPKLEATVQPRGLPDTLAPSVNPKTYPLGPVEAEDLRGQEMPFWRALARASMGLHHYDLALGFTIERMRTENVGRMLVELRYTRCGGCSTDDLLLCVGGLSGASGKSFATTYGLQTISGATVARFDLCLLAVDMKARRAINLPAFVTAQLGG